MVYKSLLFTIQDLTPLTWLGVVGIRGNSILHSQL